MRVDVAIDQYVADMQAQGRMNSAATERDYRLVPYWHADDRRQPRPALHRPRGRQAHASALATSELPAQESLGPYLLLRLDGRGGHASAQPGPSDAAAEMAGDDDPSSVPGGGCVPTSGRPRRAREARDLPCVYAGFRNGEMRGFRGRHLDRPAFIWISADIGKGGKERWIPISEELAPVADRIRRGFGPEEYVLSAQRWRRPPGEPREGRQPPSPQSS